MVVVERKESLIKKGFLEEAIGCFVLQIPREGEF